MPIAPCQPNSPEQDEQIRRMNNLASEWANPRGKYKNIARRYDNFESLERALKTEAEELLGVPFSDNFYLSKYQWDLLDQYSSKYNKRLGGKWSNFWKGFVPEGISMQDPIGRRFHLAQNDAGNYERTALAFNHEMSVKTSTALREAYLSDGQNRFSIGSKGVEQIRFLQKQILVSDSEALKLKYTEKLENLVASDEGKIVRDFITLNEMSDADFNHARKWKKYVIENNDTVSNEKIGEETVTLNPNTIKASENARKHLNRLSKVLTDGITKMEQLVDIKYDHVLGDKNNNTYMRLKQDLASAKKRIEDGQKKGGYQPRYFLENVIDMKVKLDDVLNAKNKNSVNESIDVLSNVVRSINSDRELNVMKPRNELLNNMYNQDPLFAIEQYGKEVSAYNKLASMQKVYLESMKDLGSASTDFANGLRRYITEQYTVGTRGLGDRPQFINDIVRGLSAFQTARTMGLNFTGAVKNTSSAVYFLAEMGYKNIKATHKLMNHDPDVQKALRNVEKEQGYVFPDVGRELIREGLLPAEGINKSDIDYDPFTGKITYRGDDIRSTLNEAADWSIDKLLVFHQITENLTRNFMFKTAFTAKYSQLRDHPEYMVKGRSMEDGNMPVFSNKEASKFAKNFATKMVNLYAYEYAIHAKSKYIRGQSFKVDEAGDKIIEGTYGSAAKGAVQQLGFQLTHYPMSLLQTHLRKFQGAKAEVKASRAGDGIMDNFSQMENSHFWLRYAAIFGMVNVASVALNTDFNNIIDNDLIRRAGDLNDMLDDEDESLKFGLLQQFTGPSVGHLTFALQMADIINTDDSALQEIIFGNVDYDTPEHEKYKWYQLATVVGQWNNKLYPAMESRRGSDVFRHLFKLYPSKFTKEWNEKVFGAKPRKKRTSKSLSINEKARRAALKTLERF